MGGTPETKEIRMFLPTPTNILNGPVRDIINEKIRGIGEVDRIERMDGGGLSLTVSLLGEDAPMTVSMRSADIASDNSGVSPRGLSADRPWLNNLLRDFVEGHPFPLPADAPVWLARAVKPFLLA